MKNKFPENYDSMGAKEIPMSVHTRLWKFLMGLDRVGHKPKCIAPGPCGEMSVEFDLGIGSKEYIFYPDKTRIVIFPNDGSKPTQIDIPMK